MAADRLAAAGLDALPALVEVLAAAAEVGGADPARQRAATRARRLARDLGPEARQPLLAWLASDDVPRWAGVIEALAATDASARDPDIIPFLLAPALVADTPAAARAAAVRLLERLARQDGGTNRAAAMPDAATAVATIAKRLDGTLTAAGLPAADWLLVEPVVDSRCPGVFGRTGLLAAVGVSLRRGVLWHGGFLNVNPAIDLQRRVRAVPFAAAAGPRTMGSVEADVQRRVRPQDARALLVEQFVDACGFPRAHVQSGLPIPLPPPGATGSQRVSRVG